MNRIIPYKLMLASICIISTSAPRSNFTQEDTDLIVHFNAVVNNQVLVIKKNYINPFNEVFSVEKFKFYIGKVTLTDVNGEEVFPFHRDDYFLIDFTDSGSSSVNFSFPAGRYKSINFLLGVDSIHNVSGAQTGSLDPAKGMFWTWNSGYVMAKLEGRSPESNQPGHAITYHIGGYKSPNEVAQKISLAFKQELEIESNKKAGLSIATDIDNWFAGPYPVHIKEIPACTTPGERAKNISKNYTNMFTEVRITN